MGKTSRQELYSIIDHLPDQDLDDARRLLKDLVESRDLRSPGRKMTPEEHLEWMKSLPYDDEELSDEALRRMDEGERAFREGKSYSFDEVAEELGL